jgi:hypothetical protein
MEVAMEDIVQIRLLFVAGVLVMFGVVAPLAYAVAHLVDWVRARAGRARPATRARRTVNEMPARGTR